MTTRLSGCIALLLVTSTVAVAADSNKTSWAEKMFSELEYDFGVVTKGADARHSIAIKNTFGEAITLHAAKSTCGCTTPELSTRLLQPGETGYLELKLNTVKYSRHKHPNVDVQLSFGNSAIATVRVAVTAYIRDDVTTSDDTLDFGVVGTGEPAKRSVTVNYHGRANWKITGVQDVSDDMSVEVSRPVRTSQGLTYQLNVTLSPNLPVGAFERSLVVLTEEPAKSYIPLRVRATIEPDIMVATPVVQLGTIRAGESKATRLIVRGRKPFTVEGVEGAPGTVEATVGQPIAKAVHVIPVKITPPAVEGHFSQELQVKIADGHAPVTCRVEAEVVPAGVNGELAGAGR